MHLHFDKGRIKALESNVDLRVRHYI